MSANLITPTDESGTTWTLKYLVLGGLFSEDVVDHLRMNGLYAKLGNMYAAHISGPGNLELRAVSSGEPFHPPTAEELGMLMSCSVWAEDIESGE